MARRSQNLFSNRPVRGNGVMYMTNRDKAKLYPSVVPDFTADDLFNGIYPNSASVGGPNNAARWAQSLSGGIASITGEKLRYTNNPSGTLAYYNLGYATGDFTANFDLDMVTYLADTVTSQNAQLRLETLAGAFRGIIFLTKDGGSSGTTWRVVASSGFTTESTVCPGTTLLQAKRVGSLINYEYGGIPAAAYDTNAETLRVTLYVESAWAGGSLTVDFDNYNIVDGSGNPLPLTPPV